MMKTIRFDGSSFLISNPIFNLANVLESISFEISTRDQGYRYMCLVLYKKDVTKMGGELRYVKSITLVSFLPKSLTRNLRQIRVLEEL